MSAQQLSDLLVSSKVIYNLRTSCVSQLFLLHLSSLIVLSLFHNWFPFSATSPPPAM